MNIKLRALVVDDSKVTRHMVMETLKKTGLAEFEFVQAVDGQDGLNQLQAGDVHIAFVNWNMPNMTGVEFVRAARQWTVAQNQEPIPVVMVSSEKTMAQVQEAVDEAGAEAFISQPFTVDEMHKRLERVVVKAVDIRLRAMRKSHPQPEPPAAVPANGGFFGKLFC
jgi:two-component system chemotaxis response regulator CheY